MFRSRRLVATFAVGFNVLFSLVGVFTWITFYLSAPPFLALHHRAQFTVLRLPHRPRRYPSRGIPHHARRPARRHRRSHLLLHRRRAAHACPFTPGRHPRAHHALQRRLHRPNRLAKPSPRRRRRPERASPPPALYITCYYLGGTAAGVVPGAFWALGKWPACVAFIVAHAMHRARPSPSSAGARRHPQSAEPAQVPHREDNTIREPHRPRCTSII